LLGWAIAASCSGGDDAGAASRRYSAWHKLGGDDQNSFSASDRLIGKGNVVELARAFTVDAHGVTGTPVVMDGTVYFADWAGGVYAVAADSGKLVWKKSFEHGFTSSPYVTENRIYLADRNDLVYALAREDGAVLWKESVNDHPLTQLWSSPILVEDLLIVGVAGKGTSNGGVDFPVEMLMSMRGSVVALDQETGALRWRFETTKDEDGIEYGPGASVWSSAAIDESRHAAYVGTGNSYYSPASPHSDSLIALDYRTGKPLWSHQFTKDDNFTSGSPMGPDSDVGAAPNLFTIGGRDLVGVGDKGGTYHVLDRETGDLVWEEKLTGGTPLGGIIAPAAYANGVVYVMSNKNYRSTDVVALDAGSGRGLWRQNFPGVTFGAPAITGDVLFTGTTSPTASASAGAKLYALSVADGSTLWSDELMPERAAGIAVYGDMLFTGFGFHFLNDTREPLGGGMQAYRIGGELGTANGGGAVRTGEPTFSAIYAEIMESYACTTPFCHGAGGMLALDSKQAAYDALVGVAAQGNACAGGGLERVKPGEPDASLFFLKLGATPPCGARMPLGGFLTDAEIAQIRVWIERGAKND
jgi:polyvinyl alcohol dehydrogenase (cytochrome)